MQTIKRIGAVGGAIALALCWPLAVGQIGQSVITDQSFLSMNAVKSYNFVRKEKQDVNKIVPQDNPLDVRSKNARKCL